ncbi:hypothetical protein ACFXHE_03560, partial [Nocardia sp. NPDC059229]
WAPAAVGRPGLVGARGGGSPPGGGGAHTPRPARQVPIDDLRTELDLTSVPNWGIVLRRGLVELTAHDFDLISRAMVGQ